MAAKGSEAKRIIFSKLQEIFPDSFFEEQDKILRIPINENGENVEIKVSLTAAKVNLGNNAPKSAFESSPSILSNTKATTSTVDIEPTEEEKENISKLIASLGL